MGKTYHFRVELRGHAENPVLCVRPIAYGKTLNTFSNYFEELNIPINIENIVGKSFIEDPFDLNYKLGFENSFTEKIKNYNIFSKRNLLRVLNKLGSTVDNDLRQALCFKKVLNKRVIVALKDEVKYKSNIRYGKPKRHRDFPVPRKNNKKLSK